MSVIGIQISGFGGKREFHPVWAPINYYRSIIEPIGAHTGTFISSRNPTHRGSVVGVDAMNFDLDGASPCSGFTLGPVH
jgi:hypothetical protein